MTDASQVRSASVSRDTLETQISVDLCIDGSGKAQFDTGVPFLEHMLDQIARHGMMDITVKAQGDLHIDAHHTVEDIGITLGQAFAKAVGDKKACSATATPMCPLTRHCREWWSTSLAVQGSPLRCRLPARLSVTSMSICLSSFFRVL